MSLDQGTQRELGSMERVSFQQSVILLAFFQLIVSSNAIPSARSQRMLQDTLDLQALNDTPQNTFKKEAIASVFGGRIDLDISNDYPGSGANNRHTPKPPGRKLK